MTTNTEKSKLKKRILDACIVKQQGLIDDFRIRIQSLLKTDGLGNDEKYDNNELSNTVQEMEEVNGLNETLTFALDEMNILNGMQSVMDVIHEQVERGALVVTDHNTFFVSVSIEQFDVSGKTYVGLSSLSPLFQSMKGKKAGQKFAFNGVTYKITDVF